MIMSHNCCKKALCFFVFAILCALSAYAESCSTSGRLRYSASGCSYTTEICCNGAWKSGSTCECTKTTCNSNYYWSTAACACVACGIPPNNGAPFQYNSYTTPTAEQYKANAQMCQFKVVCLDESGWRTDPGTGLDSCVCKSGYNWDRSSQTCKKAATTYTVSSNVITVKDGSYSSSSFALSVCNSSTGPRNGMITGLQGAGTYGTVSVSDCPTSAKYYNFSSCSTYRNNNGTYGYTFSYTEYKCVAK